MKILARPLIALLWVSAALAAEPLPTPEIGGLQKAAEDFVSAYNQQDAKAIADLFTEEGEILSLAGNQLTSGRAEIQALYEELFATSEFQIAIEAGSVRLVAPNLAIEDGIYHLTPTAEENAPPRSFRYTAVLTSTEPSTWKIASTRTLTDVTEGAGHLAALAAVLKGEWTYLDPAGVRLDLAFGWDPTGNYLTGEMLTTTADGEPQEGSIRIAWDASKQHIRSWMFDAKGGFTHGVWMASETGWLVRSEGTTGDGEALSASQQLTQEGSDTLIWSARQRVVDGQTLPDQTLRLVRPAPEPSAD
jgi:uncharacterized protein (TIGR02246 family)